MERRIRECLLPVAVGWFSLLGAALAEVDAIAIYNKGCAACHATGVLGAPRFGVAGDWEARRAKGIDVLVANATTGINAMPPKGGNPDLGEIELRVVVGYMLAKADVGGQDEPRPSDQAVKRKPAPTPPAKTPTRETGSIARVNTFNRLLKPPSQRNLPPAKDGIHDADNAATSMLQHPREAFAPMPKSNSGNRVDWVAALDAGNVDPRYDLQDPTREPVTLDLNIIREVKGSMPDVLYPHKQHTEWLDCSNCHPAIFIPKKGANNISMASILLGEQCGVCHGKVAFPVSECRKCHSLDKSKTAAK